MKKVLLAFLMAFTSCTQRGCQSWDRSTQFSNRKYDIKVYSGGKLIYEEQFTGIVNQEEKTDGFYYFKNDTLIEISNNQIMKSVKTDK